MNWYLEALLGVSAHGGGVVDLFRYHGKLGFASDHRAVVVILE